MLKREFFEEVIAYVKATGIQQVQTEDRAVNGADLINYAQDGIEKINETNKKKTSKPTKNQVENMAIKERIFELLAEKNEKMVASAIGEKIEISTQKATALAKQLVTEGKAVVEKVKIPKKGEQNAYSVNPDYHEITMTEPLAQPEVEEE